MAEKIVSEHSPYSAELARSITRQAGAQTYYTIGLLVDRDLIPDTYRAYGYLRWVDDSINDTARSKAERVAFIRRQKSLLERRLQDERVLDLVAEEWPHVTQSL